MHYALTLMYYVYMPHPGFYTDNQGNQPVYRCVSCQYDTYHHENIHAHLKHDHAGQILALPGENQTPAQWQSYQRGTLEDVRIGIMFLTWNTKEASVAAAHAIVHEKKRLEGLFWAKVFLFWADNGSTDGTVLAVSSVFGSMLESKVLFDTNIGQSKARNRMIDAALLSQCDYILMVDGDVEVIADSTAALTKILQELPQSVGCVGANSGNCSALPDPTVLTQCLGLAPWMFKQTPRIAWTHYGLFRRSVLQKCKFDESGPFDGPGWGFEDDDLYLQMASHGWDSLNTLHLRHQHRARHSSLRLLDYDRQILTFRARQAYLAQKWGKDPNPIVQGQVQVISSQNPPKLAT
jgi:GT2 family glycosyltransferase